MSLLVNDAIQNNSPKPLDNKYGIFASGAFRAYANVAEANATIPAAYRTIGLTVLVNTGSANVEYWYQAGIADGNLVAKGSGVTVVSPITLSSGSVSIQQSNNTQPGYLSSSDWTTFNSKLTGLSSVGSGLSIYSSASGGVASLKSIIAGSSISITDSGIALTINATPTGAANIGTGAVIYSGITGGNLQLRSIIGGTGLTVVQNTSDITLSVNNQSIPTPVTTTNTTTSILSSIPITNNTAGIVEVVMIGVVSGTTTTYTMAQRYAKYFKSAGSLTVIEVGDIISESLGTLSTANWTLVANGSTNNIDIQIQGEASTNIKWSATIQNYFNS